MWGGARTTDGPPGQSLLVLVSGKKSLPLGDSDEGSGTMIGDDGYVVYGTDSEWTNDIWTFDLEGEKWTRMRERDGAEEQDRVFSRWVARGPRGL